MVGRTRSKGCITCKARHVKCDEAKPYCVRCRRAKLTCEGYEEIAFVNDSITSRRAKQRKSKKAKASIESVAAARQTGIEEIALDKDDDSDSSSSSTSSDEHDRNRDQFGGDDLVAPSALIQRRQDSVPPLLDLQAWEDTIYTAFALETTFKGFHTDNDAVTGERGVWTTIDFIDYITTSLTSKCLNALHAASFAKRNHETQALVRSRQLYGQCLAEVNRALDDPQQCCSSATLIAIVTSGVYELMNQTNPTAWLSHAVGLTRMIKARGPESFQNQVDLRLFENCRFFIMTAAVTVRKPCIFASHRWTTIPWALDRIKRPLYQFLVDMLLELGGLLYRIDIARRLYAAHAPDAVEHGMEIEDTLSDLFKRTDKWRSRWILANGHKVTERPRPLNPVGVDADLYLEPLSFETEWWFDDLFIAHTTTSYLILLITLCTSVIELQTITQRPVSLNMPGTQHSDVSMAGLSLYDTSKVAEAALPPCLPLNDAASTLTQTGISTCRAIRYHLEEQHDGAGMVYLLPPIQFSFHAVGGEASPEGRWLMRVMGLIGSDRAGGWDFAKTLVKNKFAAETVEVLD